MWSVQIPNTDAKCLYVIIILSSVLWASSCSKVSVSCPFRSKEVFLEIMPHHIIFKHAVKFLTIVVNSKVLLFRMTNRTPTQMCCIEWSCIMHCRLLKVYNLRIMCCIQLCKHVCIVVQCKSIQPFHSHWNRAAAFMSVFCWLVLYWINVCMSASTVQCSKDSSRVFLKNWRVYIWYVW